MLELGWGRLGSAPARFCSQILHSQVILRLHPWLCPWRGVGAGGLCSWRAARRGRVLLFCGGDGGEGAQEQPLAVQGFAGWLWMSGCW